MRLGEAENVGDLLLPILSSKRIFALNLHEAGFADKAAKYFKRLKELERVLSSSSFLLYENVTPDDLRANYKYFFKRIIPTCEKCGIRMAVQAEAQK